MKSPDMEADEFHAIQTAIKNIEENEKYENRERLIRKKFDELDLDDLTKDAVDLEIEDMTISEIKDNFYEMYCILKDVLFLVSK